MAAQDSLGECLQGEDEVVCSLRGKHPTKWQKRLTPSASFVVRCLEVPEHQFLKVTVVPVAPFFQLSGRVPTMELYTSWFARVNVREAAEVPALLSQLFKHEVALTSVAFIVTLDSAVQP